MIALSASELNSGKEDVFPLSGVLAITAKDDQLCAVAPALTRRGLTSPAAGRAAYFLMPKAEVIIEQTLKVGPAVRLRSLDLLGGRRCEDSFRQLMRRCCGAADEQSRDRTGRSRWLFYGQRGDLMRLPPMYQSCLDVINTEWKRPL
jgi:hypothetical protein